jgi:hypothetical protein
MAMKNGAFEPGDRVMLRSEPGGLIGRIEPPIDEFRVGVRWSHTSYSIYPAVDLLWVPEESD